MSETQQLSPSRTVPTRRSFRDSAYAHRFQIIGFVLLGVVLVIYPFVVTNRWVDAANLAIIAAVGAIALNILLGVAGQLSLGSAAFMGLGSFTAATLATQALHLPFLLSLVAGAVVGGLAAVILGVIALRIRGFYLVLATIALFYIFYFCAQKFQEATVGITGFLMPPADIFGWQIAKTSTWYWILLIVLVAVSLGSWNLLRSKTGRAFRAIKDRDIAAAILGVNVTRTKMLAFIITSMLIGFQGALYAYYVGVVTYETYTLDLTVQYVAMIVIGGLASIGGSILGAAFVIMLPFAVQAIVPLLPSWFPFYDVISSNIFAVQSILYGIVIVLFMLRLPKGLAYAFRRLGRFIVRKLGGGPRVPEPEDPALPRTDDPISDEKRAEV